MDKKALLEYAQEQFGSDPEYLWAKHPTYCILRHKNNRKWYAAAMDVPRSRLGLPENGSVEILNVKCNSILLGSLLGAKGFLPAIT